MAFRRPERLIVAETPGEVDAALEAVDRVRASGKWVAGYASYELGYALIPSLADLMPEEWDTPLMAFGVFDKPEGPERWARGNANLAPPEPVWDAARYREAFKIVRDYIGAGDTYQVNLTFPMIGALSGDARALYEALRAHQPVRHGAFVELGVGPVILSRSPELFFRTDAEGRIETLPMKGTVARGLTEAEDVARKEWLRNDIKNRAENLMIVDLLRNDISRVAEVGSVEVPELFKVQTYTTVHQMVSRVVAQLLPDVGLGDLFRALFPCGSITGAPKIRAMEIIRELEPDPRGVYCGAIGWMAPDGASSFNVAIRTLSVFEDGKVRLNVGGGVVWDSTAPSEYEEALLKARYARLPR
ncbi:aminodeoxychorismate synthase component I [Aliiroseovarius sp. YM-037]|uniref:aminodeoxychorismate synthase component I n=1 Tax=Aliiroseovarius sp. YM-037 TaxID=3341728 RepID=UPI003A807754